MSNVIVSQSLHFTSHYFQLFGSFCYNCIAKSNLSWNYFSLNKDHYLAQLKQISGFTEYFSYLPPSCLNVQANLCSSVGKNKGHLRLMCLQHQNVSPLRKSILLGIDNPLIVDILSHYSGSFLKHSSFVISTISLGCATLKIPMKMPGNLQNNQDHLLNN